MRYVLTAAAALVVGGLFALKPAHAQSNFYQGGPVIQGKACQVITDGDQRYGYIGQCPNQPVRIAKHMKKTKS